MTRVIKLEGFILAHGIRGFMVDWLQGEILWQNAVVEKATRFTTAEKQ